MRRIISKNWLRLSLTFLMSFGISLTIASAARTIIFPTQPADDTNTEANIEKDTPNIATATPDLQSVITAWIAEELPENTDLGIAIYDLNNPIPITSSNANTIYPSENFNHWLLGYDGYRQIALGLASADEYLVSDYYAEYSLGDCLEAHLAGNNQTCTTALEADQARQAKIIDLISEHRLIQTDITAQSTTAYELGELIQNIWSSPDIDEHYWEILRSTIEKQSLIDGFTILNSSEKAYLIITLSENNTNIEVPLAILFERLKGAISAI